MDTHEFRRLSARICHGDTFFHPRFGRRFVCEEPQSALCRTVLDFARHAEALTVTIDTGWRKHSTTCPYCECRDRLLIAKFRRRQALDPRARVESCLPTMRPLKSWLSIWDARTPIRALSSTGPRLRTDRLTLPCVDGIWNQRRSFCGGHVQELRHFFEAADRGQASGRFRVGRKVRIFIL